VDVTHSIVADRPAARLVRVPLEGAPRDPWDLLDALPRSGDTRIAWYDGTTGLCFAALGVVARWSAHGPNRFADAEAFCSQFNELDSSIPLAFTSFAFADGAESDAGPPTAQVIVPRIIAVARPGELPRMVMNVPATNGPPPPARRQLSRAPAPGEDAGSWHARVTRARAAIEAGRLEKVVLARASRVTAPQGRRFDPIGTVRALRRQHPGAYCFCVQTRAGRAFLGASPETLIRVHGDGRIATHAVAGTAARGQDGPTDQALGDALIASAKDRAEQAVVTEAIRTALAPVCETLAVDDLPRLVRLPHVQHLVTNFQGRLRADACGPIPLLSLAGRLHPTPAVGGWPRAEAARWLEQHEALDRGWYAGPIGWVGSDGSGVLAVAIRSATLHGDHATAYAGAGIVSASDAEAEWDETTLKLKTAAAALQYREAPAS